MLFLLYEIEFEIIGEAAVGSRIIPGQAEILLIALVRGDVMQRLLMVVGLLVLVVSGCFPLAVAQAQTAIPVSIDGLPVVFDVQPVKQNGRTLVPFRAIAEALAVQVQWDDAGKTISATDGETFVQLQVGNRIAYCNQVPVDLDVPPQLINNRAMIPLRFFSEAFDCQVAWSDALQGVKIISPPKVMSAIGFYALGDSSTSSWANLFGAAYPVHTAGNTDIVNEVAAGWYAIDAAGNLLTQSRTGWQRPSGWETVIATAREYGMAIEMVVHEVNRDHMLDHLLESDAAVAAAVEQITDEAGLYYTGVNLDLEGLGLGEKDEQLDQVRSAFAAFVRQLADSLHSRGLTLTLTLHPPNSAYKGYDYTVLGQVANRIIIMAYDYGVKPEPVALVKQAVEQALQQVPADKLVLGISIPNENPESIISKLGLVKRYRLQGVAFWRLGLLTSDMWNVLRTSITARTGSVTSVLLAS